MTALQYNYNLGAGVPRNFGMCPTIDRERGWGKPLARSTQTPETPPIITRHSIHNMYSVDQLGCGLKESKVLSSTAKKGVDYLSSLGYDKTAEWLHKLANHLDTRGYGKIKHLEYDKEIHGTGFFSAIKDFVKEHRVGSRLLKGLSSLASIKYPVVSLGLDALGNYVESKGYGNPRMIHI